MSPIAIVGLAAQLPSGSHAEKDFDYNSFFEFLLQGGESYEHIPQTRFNVDKLRGRAVGQIVTETGAFLKDLDHFDHLEFGITAKDARSMAVGTRKLVETTFLALADSGIDYRGKNVGCYMSAVDHDSTAIAGHDDTDITGSFAQIPAMVANRVSFHFDLRGPSVPVNTACSSSLYATHVAVKALRNGECDAAVVGGAQINHRFAEWLAYSHGGILSPDGKCKPFDVSANGFGRGEGVVVVVLKPLTAAIRDGDHIYGSILGTGVNSSGSLVPANAPSAVAQRDAMFRSFQDAGRRPQEVDFVESHATGTAQGDPTEANWVGAEFKRDDELIIGSVKGNIGHLEITAFLASLVKVCGVFERGLIPPTVNITRLNPAIRWKQLGLRVPLKTEPLKIRPSNNGQALVAMTSSGIGGANGHAVIEGPPPRPAPKAFWTGEVEIPALLIAGGLSPRTSSAIGEDLLDIAKPSDQKAALARVFGRRSRSMTWRSFAVLSSTKTSNLSKPLLAPKTRPPVVFVFSGQGTQHFHMGRELFKACAPFRESVLELDKVYASIVGSSLIETTGLFTGAEADTKDPLGDPWPIAITLPALTLLQLALVDALAAVGVHPDAVIGHSAGETAVLSASGAASKAAALELAIARGRALAFVEEAKGTMAAVNSSPKEAKKIIDEVNAELGKGVLAIGCYNTPGAVTLSGAETHIDLAVAKASAAGIFARKLKTRVPVHSELMELCHEEFDKLVAELFAGHEIGSPKVSVYSTVTGGLYERKFEPSYYWNGTLGPVRFEKAIQTLLTKIKNATFVEIGPHPVLTAYLQSMSQAEGRENTPITCPLRRPRAPESGVETFEFVSALGKVVTAGHNGVDFDVLYGSGGSYTGPLPHYPFAPKTVPWAVVTPEFIRQRQQRNGPLNHPQLQINTHTHPGLADYVIKGEPVVPAAGFIEMALEFGASEVYNVQFHDLLSLSSERPTPVQVKLEGTKWSVRSAGSPDYAKTWPINYNRLHASGFLSLEPIQDRGVPRLDIDAIRQRMKPVDVESFYTDIAPYAQLGRLYSRINHVHLGVGKNGAVEALTEIRAHDKDLSNFEDYVFHPAILEAVIHVVVNPRLSGNYDHNLYFFSSRLAALRLLPAFREKPFPNTIFAHATFVNWAPESITYNYTIADPHGEPLAVIEGLEVALHGRGAKAIEKRYDVVYHSLEASVTKPRDESQPSAVNGINGGTNGHANGDLNGDASDRSVTPPDRSEPILLVLPYVRGEELRIQKEFAQHDTAQLLTVVLVAEDGLDGDASLGFTRALRKEYPAWTIRVAVFDKSWSPPKRERAAHELLLLATDELDLRVEADGTLAAPRIVSLGAPKLEAPFDAQKPWKIEDGAVTQTSVPHVDEDGVVVRVEKFASHHGDLWAYIGSVVGTSQKVIGVASGFIRSHVAAHYGSVVELTSEHDDIPLALSILAPTLVSLAVGTLDHRRLRGLRALVYEPDDELRSQLDNILSSLGVTSLSIAALTSSELEKAYLHNPSFVFSGARDPKQILTLRQISPSRAQISLWNDAGEGLAFIATHKPWALGDAVRQALAYKPRPTVKSTALETLLADIPTSIVPQSLDLFDSTKAYLLVGGLGSLGLHIALWLYQNGARHIILTSRSGVDSLERRGDYLALRIFTYLHTRKGLVVDTVAVDATSLHAMTALVQGLSRPIGGALLLTTTYSDGTLASHTEESFERAFPAKVDGFRVLEQVVDVSALDFLVTFSSVVGVFGNPGQTNYAAANTALAGLTRKYKNAFSMVAPLILDSAVITASEDSHVTSRLRYLIKWGLTARELCDYIADGIRKLQDGGVSQYVPDLDWAAVRDSLGTSRAFEHLVPKDADEGREAEETQITVAQVVCRVLDLKENEISPNVPLTTYGLDSLSAVALSFALRPIHIISQLQLLADMSISDIEKKVDVSGTISVA